MEITEESKKEKRQWAWKKGQERERETERVEDAVLLALNMRIKPQPRSQVALEGGKGNGFFPVACKRNAGLPTH